MSEYITEWYWDEMRNAPNQDQREEIVRCRDCKYADETESGLLLCNGYLVDNWDYYNDEPSIGKQVEPDGFCAWGERRSE